jgi:hypothetical protein
MRFLNNRNDDDELLSVDDVDVQNQAEPKSRGKSKANRLVADIMGGDIFTKDGFVSLFPFLICIVFLSMLYITNVYIAEDMSREIARLNRKVEDLHVEYVYLKSQITKVTK